MESLIYILIQFQIYKFQRNTGVAKSGQIFYVAITTVPLRPILLTRETLECHEANVKMDIYIYI
jgi:hypothetical protein